MLSRVGCRKRQERLLAAMAARDWDLFVTGDPRTAYYLTGSLAPADSAVAFLLWADGASVLLSPAPGEALAAEIVPVESYSIHRVISQPFHDLSKLLADLLRRKPTAERPAIERGWTPGLVEQLFPAFADATATVLRLRKHKEEDEVAEIRESLRLCAAAYDAAREAIAPGRSEVDIYNAMSAAVNRTANGAVTLDGDFACGARAIRGGGPPTGRRLAPGELYILDLFPAPAFYFGDVCRTFAVSGPTDEQLEAWEMVREAQRRAAAAVKPGVPARTVYHLVKDYLDSFDLAGRSFWHHAGHGVGYRGHESPRIIPASDDVFEVGDVLALEPGIYSEALGGGIRLEDNYVLSERGLENLFPYPLEL